MKAAFVLTFWWLELVFVIFGPSGSDALLTNGGGLERPKYSPICLPPTDDHPSTKFAPKKEFYKLGDTIIYQCRDKLSTFLESNKRYCIGFPGAFIGFWTQPIPVCMQGCRNQCGVSVVFPEQCSCHPLCGTFYGLCCSNYEKYCVRNKKKEDDDEDDDNSDSDNDDSSDGNSSDDDSDNSDRDKSGSDSDSD